MAIQYINTGTAPNQGNGDTLRAAFTKANANFKLFEDLTATPIATSSTLGVVIAGDGISVDTSTGIISAFNGDYNNLVNIPQPLGINDSPQFTELFIGTELGEMFPFTGINANYYVDDYTQTMFQNHVAGATATTDLIMPNDAGDQTTNMIDLGINSTAYIENGFSLQTPGSGYLFTNGADLFIGTQSPGTKLVFHAGGTTTGDSGGTLDAYAWRFNRDVQVTVSTPGPLNFTVQNTLANSAATAMYQAISDDNNTIMMGVNSSARTDGLIQPGEGFIHLDGTGKTMHIGNKSDINFYANAQDGYTVNPMLSLKQNGTDAVLDGRFIPYEDSLYDLGSSTATWRSLYLSTGTIYMGGVPIEMNTLTNTLIVNGVEVGAQTQLTNNGHVVSLGADATLSVPDQIQLHWAGDNSLTGTIGTGPGGFSLVAEQGKAIAVITENTSTPHFWLYDSDGFLTLPNGTAIGDFYSNTGTTIFNSNGPVQLYSNTADAFVDIRVKGTGGDSTWTFDSTGTVTTPQGYTLSQNTASATRPLADMILSNVLAVSTTSTDVLSIGEFGATTSISAPYSVFQFTTTPPVQLQVSDLVAGAGIPVTSTVLSVGTGTWTSTIIIDADFSEIYAIGLVPMPGDKIILSRPTNNFAFNISTPASNDIALTPGVGGSILVNSHFIPLSDSTVDLGSTANRWNQLWMGPGTIFIKDENTSRDVAISARNGLLTVLGTGGLEVGEFVFEGNSLKIKDLTADITIGQTTATGFVQFNRPVKMVSMTGGTAFQVNRNGYVQINAPSIPTQTAGALNIVGSTNGNYQPVNGIGGMLHITGNQDASVRVTLDGYTTSPTAPQGAASTGAGLISMRTARGTPDVPLKVLANDTLGTIAALGYVGTGGYSQGGVAGLLFHASEDFNSSASLGTYATIQLTPTGSNIAQDAVRFYADGIRLGTTGPVATGITFADSTRQTTAFTGTIVASNITGLGTAAVTSISIGTGLSGAAGPGIASINNTGVLSVVGTANQILVNNVGQNITLSTPQDLATTATVTFKNITVTGTLNVTGTGTNNIPSVVTGKTLYLANDATTSTNIDGGGIILGTGTFVKSFLYDAVNNWWDTDGANLNTLNLIADSTVVENLSVTSTATFGNAYNNYNFTNAPIQIDSDVNSYAQISYKNHSNGTSASAGFTVFNDLGIDGSGYITTGIVSSTFNDPSYFTAFTPNDSYMFNNANNLLVGTLTTGTSIKFFTDGPGIGNIKATINSQGLTVVNTVTAALFIGTLTGNVIGNITGQAGSAVNGVVTTGTYANPTWITSLAGSKITGIVQTATTVVNGIYSTDTGTVTNNMLAGNIPNNKLANNQITLNAGAGINVSVASPSLGGSTTISNTGVTTITAGTATSISTSSGNIVIWSSIPIGFTGSAGAGFTGSQGNTGFVGSQGTTGFTGSTGTQGPAGFVGSQGVIGFTGSIGATGFVGSQGIIGFTGSIGFVGSQGSTGFVGSQGDIGFTGSRGSTGIQGFVGSQGTTGFVGSTGFIGSQGTTGFTGSAGVNGVTSISVSDSITVTTSTGAVTIGSNATSTNITNTLVMRNGTGNFSANEITSKFYSTTPVELGTTSTTITVDLSAGDLQRLTVTGNVVITPINPVAGRSTRLVLIGSGNRTVTHGIAAAQTSSKSTTIIVNAQIAVLEYLQFGSTLSTDVYLGLS